MANLGCCGFADTTPFCQRKVRFSYYLFDGVLAFVSVGGAIAVEDFYPGFTSITGFGFLNGILQSTGEVASTLGAIMANNFQPAKLAY